MRIPRDQKLPVDVYPQLNNLAKAQIEGEIVSLLRQQKQLNIDADGVDFSMLQTYKEMIHSRKDILDQMPITH